MFVNLYVQEPDFGEHNFADFLDRIEPVEAIYIRKHIESSYSDEHDPFEPYFFAMMRLTLSPGTAAAYIRTHPNLPITERDCRLSKLFQFLYVPLEIHFGLPESPEWETRVSLEELLDSLPDHHISRLQEFDWWSFYKDTRSHDLDRVISRLRERLPSFSDDNTPVGEKAIRDDGIGRASRGESVGALSAGGDQRQAVESAQMPPAQEPQGPRESRKAKKPVRRSAKYEGRRHQAMRNTTNRKLIAGPEALSKTATALIDELLENDWPIPFIIPPQAEDRHWLRLAQTRGTGDPEVVSRLQKCQKIKRHHLNWEVEMHGFLHMCRSYLNDFGEPGDKSRFEGSGLVLIAQSDYSSMSRVTYDKDQCLADLQSIARLVSRVRKPGVRESVGALNAGGDQRQAVESAQVPFAQEPQGPGQQRIPAMDGSSGFVPESAADPHIRKEPTTENGPFVGQEVVVENKSGASDPAPTGSIFLETPVARKAATDNWKRNWSTPNRECTNDDLTETAFGGKDRSFLNQWQNGKTRLADPSRSTRVQAIEKVLRENIRPKSHPEFKRSPS